MRWIWLFLLAVSGLAAELPPGVDPVQLGQSLAEQLRSTAPSEAAEFTGVLKIRKPGFTNSVPIECRIDMRPGGWTVTYETKGGGNQPRQRLIIKHAPDKPNVYLYAEGKSEPRELARHELNLPIAGSDFWLMDLGLDFLFWPQQRVTKLEMRLGRSCRILESRDPKPIAGGYARVLSWVDVETDGILMAEAYATGDEKPLKKFKVGSFKKVKGKYELQDMEIENPKAKTRTKLEFDLPK
ncbi:MAG TPA: outer membrane lipoprotein-sorting protein [Candidatus Binatia bacterium]|nr:outer membrane lipoprotein-sorting protein [Candidatus Binatia bacterium]